MRDPKTAMIYKTIISLDAFEIISQVFTENITGRYTINSKTIDLNRNTYRLVHMTVEKEYNAYANYAEIGNYRHLTCIRFLFLSNVHYFYMDCDFHHTNLISLHNIYLRMKSNQNFSLALIVRYQ